MLKLGKRFINKQILPNTRPFAISSKNLKNDNEKDINISNQFFDIVISGGGIVGNAMAVVLGQDNLFKNLNIALIDTFPEEKNYCSPEILSNRVCALNSTTIDLLKSL